MPLSPVFRSKLDNIILNISNKGQMTEKEYRYIIDFCHNKNILVFGCGKDSEIWRLVSKKALFLEHNKEWIDNKLNDVIKVSYSSKMDQTDYLLDCYLNGDFSGLYAKEILDNDLIKSEIWDNILVDAPEGYDLTRHHGRIQSIFASKILANKNTNIFIHDIDRKIENECWRTFGFNLVESFDRLGHFKI